MHKLAESDYPLHELISNRWSPVAFADRPVEQEKLGSLLEAARWAPSSYNEQPWVYVVATKDDPPQHERLLNCLVDANIEWAKNAPLLFLAVAQLNFARNGKPNRHAFHDVGMANENLVLQATALGLATHQMAGFNVEKAREVFAIPEGYEPLTMIAAGYQADPDESLYYTSLSRFLQRQGKVPEAEAAAAEAQRVQMRTS